MFKENFNGYDETAEVINRFIEDHVTDIKLGSKGEQGKLKNLGGTMAVCEAEIFRCKPPLKIDKLVLGKGKSLVLSGPNGAGKTTLFDAIQQIKGADIDGNSIYNSGAHNRDELLRIARLDQEEVLKNIADKQVEEILNSLKSYFKEEFPVDWEDIDWEDTAGASKAQEQNEINDQAQQRIEELFTKVGQLFDVDDFKTRKVKELSGGERTKLSLIMLMCSEPDVLLLDEPTNHLDLKSIAKLMGIFEKYKQAGITIVSVSHTKWFLEMAGVDGTLDLKFDEEGRRMNYSTSPYSKYIKKEKNNGLIKEKIEWEECWNNEGKPLIVSKEEVNIPDSPLSSIDTPSILFGDMVVISGDNGTGKTKLMEQLALDDKKIIEKEKGVQIAYLPQFWPKEIAGGTVEEFFNWIKQEINPHSDKTSAKFIKKLAQIGFSGRGRQTLKTPLSTFSGGEQRLLWFAAASIFEGTDMLVLDEPTNHMDSDTVDKIIDTIRGFGGAVVLSTHDLKLMEQLDRDSGGSRAGSSIRHILFEKTENKNSVMHEISESPHVYAQEVISKAKNEAKRIKV